MPPPESPEHGGDEPGARSPRGRGRGGGKPRSKGRGDPLASVPSSSSDAQFSYMWAEGERESAAGEAAAPPHSAAVGARGLEPLFIPDSMASSSSSSLPGRNVGYSMADHQRSRTGTLPFFGAAQPSMPLMPSPAPPPAHPPGSGVTPEASEQQEAEENHSKVKRYTRWVSELGRRRQWQKACGLLGEMRQHQATPDVITYTAVFGACQRAHAWEASLRLLREMPDRGIEANIITYNAAIGACSNAYCWERTLSLLAETRQLQLSPNVITYDFTIGALQRARQWEKALQVLADMRRDGVTPNKTTYKYAMEACQASNSWQHVLVLLRNIKEDEQRQEQETQAEAGGPGAKQMRAKHTFAESSSPIAASSGSSSSKAGNWELACRLLQRLRLSMQSAAARRQDQRRMNSSEAELGEGSSTNVAAYNSAIQACEAHKQWETVIRLFKDMVSDNLMPDLVAYNAMMDVCDDKQQWQRVFELYAEMRSRGLQPDMRTYNIVANSCIDSEQWEAALSVLESIRSTPGLVPDEPTMSAVISSCVAAHRWDRAWALAREEGSPAVLTEEAVSAVYDDTPSRRRPLGWEASSSSMSASASSN